MVESSGQNRNVHIVKFEDHCWDEDSFIGSVWVFVDVGVHMVDVVHWGNRIRVDDSNEQFIQVELFGHFLFKLLDTPRDIGSFAFGLAREQFMEGIVDVPESIEVLADNTLGFLLIPLEILECHKYNVIVHGAAVLSQLIQGCAEDALLFVNCGDNPDVSVIGLVLTLEQPGQPDGLNQAYRCADDQIDHSEEPKAKQELCVYVQESGEEEGSCEQ